MLVEFVDISRMVPAEGANGLDQGGETTAKADRDSSKQDYTTKTLISTTQTQMETYLEHTDCHLRGAG